MQIDSCLPITKFSFNVGIILKNFVSIYVIIFILKLQPTASLGIILSFPQTNLDVNVWLNKNIQIFRASTLYKCLTIKKFMHFILHKGEKYKMT